MYNWLNGFYRVMDGKYSITLLFFGSNTRRALLLRPRPSTVLMDSVSFHNITTFSNTNRYNIISLKENSKIIIFGTVKFLHNHVPVLIDFYDNNIKYIVIKENGTLIISHNKVWSLFCTKLPTTKYPYPFCLFQYFTSSTSNVRMEKRNFLIKFHNNLRI